MGATNHTTNYNLSQFDPTDKPAWLQDYNGDMTKIDAGINTAQLAADAAQLTANTADGKADSANSAITNTITPAISALQTASTNQGGAINTINSLIGNGTPTTTDQTIIGAINEINAEVGTISSSLDWKEFATPITSTAIELPTAREYLFVANIGSGVMLTINVPSHYLTGGPRGFRSGYDTGTSNGMISISIENGEASIESAFLNGNSVNPVCYAYYR